MSGLSLRAKLMAMNTAHSTTTCASAPCAPRHELSVRVTRLDLPDRLLEAPDPRALARMGAMGDWPGIERVLFLDTETTGLTGGAGTLAFLIGLGYVNDGAFVTEQYLMGDYPDELAMLTRLAERMRGFDALVTFNGRAFDMPLLETRRTMLRLGALPELMHIDLLPPARRLWRKRLGSVKLSVLEEKVLHQGRMNDLPGSEAPRRFFDALKTGDRSLLDPVLEHNLSDVYSMAALLVSLISSYAGPSERLEPYDLLSLGRVLERGDERAEAARCYRMASMPRAVTSVAALRGQRASGEALFALGMLYKRMGEYARAAQAFEALIARRQVGAPPMIELAKLKEHRMRDFACALDITRSALAIETDARTREALMRRCTRLERKIGGRTDGT